MRSIGRRAERTFERQLEQILRIPFRQTDQWIGDDRLMQCFGQRRDARIDNANGKVLGDTVNLIAESGWKSFTGESDLDKWPLTDRQIRLEVEGLQLIAKFGQTHIARCW